MRKCILTILLLSNLLNAEFIRNDVKEIVQDTTTCLEWQDNIDVNNTRISWQKAIDYCEALTLDGGKWRLPNINELHSIVDRNRYNPAIKSSFKYVILSDYWSSTTNASTIDGAWYMNFGNGLDYWSDKNRENYVRCVRDIE